MIIVIIVAIIVVQRIAQKINLAIRLAVVKFGFTKDRFKIAKAQPFIDKDAQKHVINLLFAFPLAAHHTNLTALSASDIVPFVSIKDHGA